VLSLIEAMLKAGRYGEVRLFPTERGTPHPKALQPSRPLDRASYLVAPVQALAL
jgi:hypothetical protein